MKYKISDRTYPTSRILGEVDNIDDAPAVIMELAKTNPYYKEAEILVFDKDDEHDAGDMAIAVGDDIKLITIER
jgi:hypothetical protein